MTNQDRELLLVDLAGRIPYNVKCHYVGMDSETFEDIDKIVTLYSIDFDYFSVLLEEDSLLPIDKVMPYLFPLSSMTEQQETEFAKLFKKKNGPEDFFYDYEEDMKPIQMLNYYPYEILDWLNRNHFDYRGLIDKGIAMDASGLNIY